MVGTVQASVSSHHKAHFLFLKFGSIESETSLPILPTKLEAVFLFCLFKKPGSQIAQAIMPQPSQEPALFACTDILMCDSISEPKGLACLCLLRLQQFAPTPGHTCF